MTTRLLREAVSLFPYSWRHTGGLGCWQASIETMRRFLFSLGEADRHSLYFTVARMIGNRSFRGPGYLKLWFFSHPSYEIFTKFLQDEELCQAFASYLDIISSCQRSQNAVSHRRLKTALAERSQEVRLLVEQYCKLVREHDEGTFCFFEPDPSFGAVLIPYPEVSEQSLAGVLCKGQRSVLVEKLGQMERTYPQSAWMQEFRRIFELKEEWLAKPITVEAMEGLIDDIVPNVAVEGFTLNIPRTWCPIQWLEDYLLELMTQGGWAKFYITETETVEIREASSVIAYDVNTELLADIAQRFSSRTHVQAVELRSVRHGLLPVGLKIHCVTTKPRGTKFLTKGNFQAHNAGTSFNLPPVGSTKAMAEMLRKIEERSGVSFLENPDYQIQVCSAGELSPRNAALLGVGFYLASDPIRRYSQADFNNTALKGPFGRLIIYGANVCDLAFDWWEKDEQGKLQVEALQKKLKNRTDVLSCQSMRDIENVNIMATLLMHAQYKGYWAELGEQFITEMEGMLEKHQLIGILDADWVMGWSWTQGQHPSSASKQSFWEAFEELMNYAFAESERIKRAAENGNREAAGQGILFEMQQMLQWYRAEIELQSP